MHLVATTLLVIGGLNWLLLALTGWDISQVLGGMESLLARSVFVLIGLSALYELSTHIKRCKTCEAMKTKKAKKKGE